MAGYQEMGDQVPTFAKLARAEDRSIPDGALPELTRRIFAKNVAELRSSGKWSREEDPFTLHPIAVKDMLEQRIPRDMLWVVSSPMVWIVGIVGGLVLVVGAVNFTVLSLVRSVYRAKEIGLRKVTGAWRGHVIGQHVVEAILLCGITTVTGGILAHGLMPEMAVLFSIPNYEMNWSPTPLFWVFLFGNPLVVGTVAGFYPAYVASRTEPVAAMRGSSTRAKKGRLARSLVMVQFAGAVFLLASTQVMLDQYYHGRSLDRGYDPTSLLMIDVNSADYELI
tara:strand:+ start:2163 stop:3002 length:840 start_codon:yes stop_codon:yes gene_type:complete